MDPVYYTQYASEHFHFRHVLKVMNRAYNQQFRGLVFINSIRHASSRTVKEGQGSKNDYRAFGLLGDANLEAVVEEVERQGLLVFARGDHLRSVAMQFSRQYPQHTLKKLEFPEK